MRSHSGRHPIPASRSRDPGRILRLPVLGGAALGMMALAGLLLATAQVAYGQAAPAAVHLQIDVTDVGFNNQEGDYYVEVAQGAMVQLDFVWGQGNSPDQHTFALDGYGLQTEQLDAAHPQVSLKFIADKPGTFDLKCDLDCDIHHALLKGHLKVSRSAAGGVVSPAGGGTTGGDASPGGSTGGSPYISTSLTLSPSSWTSSGQALKLTSELRDASGNPVPRAEVSYYLDTTFAGVTDKMLIGTARTDASGVASLDYTPTISGQDHNITAKYEGAGLYAESEQAISIQAPDDIASAYTVAPIGLDGVRHWAPWALAAIVLILWSTFAFVLFQAVGIRRVRSTPARMMAPDPAERRGAYGD